MKNCKVNGVKINAVDSRFELIESAFKQKSILIAVNAEKILNSTPQSINIINRNMGYPDGYGAVLALKRNGFQEAIKIPGCELWLDIISRFYKNKRFYFIGGRQEVIESTVVKLKKEFPQINIANFRNGYITNDREKQDLINDIIDKKPDIVFVAMGSPLQEILMEELSKIHPALYQGLGGSFDVYTGKVNRAPEWWLKNNLEWLYRLLQEPFRIKRQIHLVKFLFLLYSGRFNS
ncbi:WecB/TagA/CpsF family glycosyltransferase [Vibrio parahaemolyticus]|uniref:WecB/TagA/CpsF family glycosyltransferase n=2 Tax=Vibrio parahaemolyticus TaxID=670 RepID=UPI00235EAEF3|nr:WecB/TagA/CpsF family glycosyltransferase [Vibrio parahaemolyticus]ELB2103022.1 WecB/TagA/CpsF family glycosyltransferase [Vibrio parahaemolyticus]HCG5963946.1 WecB/TagA/CpsF family glycosyltransferase [Vibrio parahaemolyticus]HCG7779029.1 WecB/TagA/CpsF family glycosyltransferase [Vibrio parahaemolyticus]HCH4902124.1 WecB/TagA/CpsF family glycosyltransferase [Vibrio parahaemolyticus]